MNIAKQFDAITELHQQSSTHSEAKLEKDIKRIVQQLHVTSKVFHFVPGRKHKHFKSLSGSLINVTKKDRKGIITWMKGHLKKLRYTNELDNKLCYHEIQKKIEGSG